MTTALKDAGAALEQSATDEPDPSKGQLFDKSQYEREDLQIAKIDGQTVDKIKVSFSGSVMLDRADPADVALYNRLMLGQECELRVAGKVSGTGGGYTTSKGGELDAIIGEKKINVSTVWVLTPEQL